MLMPIYTKFSWDQNANQSEIVENNIQKWRDGQFRGTQRLLNIRLDWADMPHLFYDTRTHSIEHHAIMPEKKKIN